MIVGNTKEMKEDEYRVAVPPMAVEALTRAGHKVLLQSGSGEASGFSDEEYKEAHADIVDTSTIALSHATLPYVLKLANLGLEEALKADYSLVKGLNTYKGKLTNRSVAEALDLKYTVNSEILD